MSEKVRLDVLLKEKKITTSRSKAKRLIMAGKVYVEGQLVDKPGAQVDFDSQVEIKKAPHPYVSRGGVKLAKALENFRIVVSNKKALDIGASTGGFTDCLLKNGASKVWAVDVGYGQLDWNLRKDPRVIVLEKVNARYLQLKDIGEQVDLATVDVSFISIKKILPPLTQIVKERGNLVILVKPQFEAGPQKVGKGGIIRDPQIHIDVLNDLIKFTCQNLNISVLEATFSPIKGGSGNIEFFLWLKNTPQKGEMSVKRIEKLVENAWEKLK